jgi:HlyD family secretion protein
MHQKTFVYDAWKRPLAIGALLLAGALGLYYLLRDDPIPVDLHMAKRAPLTVTIDEEGVTEIRNIFKVSAPITGRIKRSPLVVGDPVRQVKTIVASLEPLIPAFLDIRTRRILDARASAANAAVDLPHATVARATADLEFRNKELQRAEKLIKRKTVSQHHYDEAVMAQKTSTAALNTAIAQLSMRQRELESARAQLIEPSSDLGADQASCCIRVYAPVSGRVIRIVTESETVVQSGAPLLELGDPADLEIAVDLLSIDAVRVQEGAKAEIVSWGGAKRLHAVVSRIEPTGFKKVSALGIEEQRVKVRLAIEEPFEQRLRLGHDYRVYVRIIEWTGDKVLSVPLSALFRQGDAWTVFLVNDGISMLRTVVVGRKNSQHAQITKGLAEGDRVILHPNDRIREGTRVTER